MNSRYLWMLGLAFLMVAGPVYSGTAVQMWACEMEDDATEEAIEAHASEWLKAARTIDGGENFEAYVLFPVAVNATREMDIMFVVTAPSFAEWGKFWDAYPDSEAAQNEGEHTVCPDSVLWESVKVK